MSPPWREMDDMVRELGRLRLLQEECRGDLPPEAAEAQELEMALTAAAGVIVHVADEVGAEREAALMASAWHAIATAQYALERARTRAAGIRQAREDAKGGGPPGLEFSPLR